MRTQREARDEGGVGGGREGGGGGGRDGGRNGAYKFAKLSAVEVVG